MEAGGSGGEQGEAQVKWAAGGVSPVMSGEKIAEVRGEG